VCGPVLVLQPGGCPPNRRGPETGSDRNHPASERCGNGAESRNRFGTRPQAEHAWM
jgi:hypothetical protein